MKLLCGGKRPIEISDKRNRNCWQQARTAFSGIHTEHRILQVGFTLLWEDQYGSDFYYCYYQNPVLGLKQKMQVLCHKLSSCSLCSLIHEVLQFSYFNHFLAGITTGFLRWLTILAVDLPRCLKSSLYFYS